MDIKKRKEIKKELGKILDSFFCNNRWYYIIDGKEEDLYDISVEIQMAINYCDLGKSGWGEDKDEELIKLVEMYRGALEKEM